jgi:hypothetical protein
LEAFLDTPLPNLLFDNLRYTAFQQTAAAAASKRTHTPPALRIATLTRINVAGPQAGGGWSTAAIETEKQGEKQSGFPAISPQCVAEFLFFTPN